MLENNEGNKKSVAKTFVNAQGGVDRAARRTCVPSPQPSLGPLTGVRVRRNSSSVADGSTPAASYRSPFTATTTAFPIWSPPPQPRSATTASCPCSRTGTARYLQGGEHRRRGAEESQGLQNRGNRSGPVPVWAGTKPTQIQNSNLNSKKMKNSQKNSKNTSRCDESNGVKFSQKFVHLV